MMTFFTTIACIAVLLIEGKILARILGRGACTESEEWAIGYFCAALLNAFLFLVLYVFGVSFTATSVGLGHGFALVVLLFVIRYSLLTNNDQRGTDNVSSDCSLWIRCMYYFCITSLIVIFLHALAYALYLPLTYYDSFVNWHLRSKMQLIEQTFVFVGHNKPQYPPLLHTLHMLPGVFTGWSAAAANAMTFVLSLAGSVSVYLFTKRMIGPRLSLLCLTFVLGIPLVSVHLRQGYADLHFVFALLLSVITLQLYQKVQQKPWVLLSVLLCAVSAWTKLEGLYFGVVFWMMFYGYLWYRSPNRSVKNVLGPVFLLIALVAPWPLLVRTIDLPLSPHGVTWQWNIEHWPLVLDALFIQGSFGVHWYAIVIGILCFVLNRSLFNRSLALWWGVASLGLTFCIFLGTTDVIYLQNNDTFSRTMLISTVLLTYGFVTMTFEAFSLRPKAPETCAE